MDAGRRSRGEHARSPLRRLRETLEAGAFWAAVRLPVGYVPALAADVGGIERKFLLLLVVLVAVHLLALWCGPDARTRGDGDETPKDGPDPQ